MRKKTSRFDDDEGECGNRKRTVPVLFAVPHRCKSRENNITIVIIILALLPVKN